MRILKFLVTFILALSMLFSFVSCDSDTETSTTAPPPPQEPAQLIIHVDETVTIPGTENTAQIKFADAVKLIPSKEGFVFAGWYSDAELKDYIIPNHITSTQYSKGELYPKWIKVDPVSITVRSDSATITDSGRAKQMMDTVLVEEHFDMTDLKRAGYTKLRVTISFDACEVNDGYQYVFLYQDTNCPSSDDKNSVADVLFGSYLDEILGSEDSGDPSLLWARKFEHGGNKKNTTWETHTYEALISIDSVQDNLYIRYGPPEKMRITGRIRT